MHLCQGYTDGGLNKAFAFGGAGVHVFILCSGFGLYLSYLRNPIGYVDFLKRRFGKVWIPYAMSVLLWGIWLMIITGIFPIKELLSHLLLYKMFSNELDTSLCYPYWFISTIFQFYLTWPLILKIFRISGGLLLIISLVWSTMVGFLGLEEERPWGSFFLQYLWEFALGMWIAGRCMDRKGSGLNIMNIDSYRWYWLIFGAIGGMGVSAMMAWNGGILKLYNDIPSLIGYLSVAFIIYKLSLSAINTFFEWANGFSYELYLVHSLVYVIAAYALSQTMPIGVVLASSFVAAYVVAYEYKQFLLIIGLSK